MPKPLSDDEREARGCWMRYMLERGESWAAIGRSLGMGGQVARSMYWSYERMVRAKVADQEAELAELERLKPWLAGWANYKDRFEQLKAVAES